MHIQQKGKKTGHLVNCRAQIKCRVKDSDPAVVEEVLKNPNCPMKLMLEFADLRAAD